MSLNNIDEVGTSEVVELIRSLNDVVNERLDVIRHLHRLNFESEMRVLVKIFESLEVKGLQAILSEGVDIKLET